MKYESSFKSEADGLEISVMALIPDKKPIVQLLTAGSWNELSIKRDIFRLCSIWQSLDMWW